MNNLDELGIISKLLDEIVQQLTLMNYITLNEKSEKLEGMNYNDRLTRQVLHEYNDSFLEMIPLEFREKQKAYLKKREEQWMKKK